MADPGTGAYGGRTAEVLAVTGVEAAQERHPARAGAADEPGFGIYIHWPFCAQKCPYCDFNSHVRHGGWDEPRFLAAYLRELETVAGWAGAASERPAVSSVFFGGGTPSLSQPVTVAAILDRIAALWGIEQGAEITLEANPNSVDAARFAGYRTAGVNRVSIGVQSLRDPELKKLGRLHSAAEARAAVEIARRTFERYSLDLIYARPGQTVSDWHGELSEALALADRHLSLYQLTIEPDTPFFELHARGKLVVPDPDLALDLFQLTQDLTAKAGLPAYEISNHAAPGEESRHNLLYWRYGSYAGVGPGAHGRLLRGGRRLATATERGPEAWLGLVEAHGHGFKEREPLSCAEQADEMLLMGLRLNEGLDLAAMARRFGRAPSRATVAALAADGRIEVVGRTPHDGAHARIRASGDGRFILNALVLQLSRGMVPE